MHCYVLVQQKYTLLQILFLSLTALCFLYIIPQPGRNIGTAHICMMLQICFCILLWLHWLLLLITSDPAPVLSSWYIYLFHWNYTNLRASLMQMCMCDIPTTLFKLSKNRSGVQHSHLKTVYMTGFYGCKGQIELAHSIFWRMLLHFSIWLWIQFPRWCIASLWMPW